LRRGIGGVASRGQSLSIKDWSIPVRHATVIGARPTTVL
jgi:hypothetical protein